MKYKIKLVIIIAACIFGGLVVSFSSQRAQTRTSQVETAGQRFKNIKVLNDMPADQLGKVMNIFSASLGVNCDFCHYGEDFEKDGKKEKETARDMIKMTMSLNKDHFRGRPEVSCNTCHHGLEHPQAQVNLSPEPIAERPKQPEPKPNVEQIIDKYVAALGGAQKLAKIKSREIKSVRVEPDGRTTEPENKWFKEGKYFSETMYGTTSVTEGFDGTKGWKAGNKAAIYMKPDEAEQLRREGELSAPEKIKQIYPKMEYRALDRIDGHEVYVVFATAASGTRERLFFDVATGLLVRRSTATPTMFGNYVYQVDYLDYKLFGGVKWPATVKYSMPNIRWTSKVVSLKNNPQIDDKRFESIAAGH